MATTRQTLKQYFRQYATPTEAQFAELIDAFVHKDEDSLTQSKIDGLVAALEGKASTNQVNTMVASKVTEIVSDPNFAAAPTAHSHVAADVEGLSAFITRVTNFLDSADVSDTTINRWKEIETFLTGITDQETLAGLLLQLKNEITALIPTPAPTNYLKQISDLDAYTTAQEGEIVQYVGSTTAKYTRGYCYEFKEKRVATIFSGASRMIFSSISDSNLTDLGASVGQIIYHTNDVVQNLYKDSYYGSNYIFGEPQVGKMVYNSGMPSPMTITSVEKMDNNYSVTIPDLGETLTFVKDINHNRKWWVTNNGIMAHSVSAGEEDLTGICFFERDGNIVISKDFTSVSLSPVSENYIVLYRYIWQPIVTSPSVS